MSATIPTKSQPKSIILAFAAGLAFGSVAALADSPHFLKATATLNTTTGALTCSWKEAGLGDNQSITYVCSADATATYVCVNRGGANPSAQNKESVEGPVSATGDFSSGKNGQITGSLTVHPPGAGSFSCPPGQSLELAQATFTNVKITDTDNGIVAPVVGTFSTGCLLPEVRGAC
jgi:hypothetical protein